MALKNKAKNNYSFVLSVCLMVVLIVSLMVPTATAWFTRKSSADGNVTINFGSINLDILDPTDGDFSTDGSSKVFYDTNDKQYKYILPGDVLKVNINLKNAGTCDMYVMPQVNFKIEYKIYYTDEEKEQFGAYASQLGDFYWLDITTLLSDYIEVDVETPTVQEDNVFELSQNQTLTLMGKIKFLESLLVA